MGQKSIKVLIKQLVGCLQFMVWLLNKSYDSSCKGNKQNFLMVSSKWLWLVCSSFFSDCGSVSKPFCSTCLSQNHNTSFYGIVSYFFAKSSSAHECESNFAVFLFIPFSKIKFRVFFTKWLSPFVTMENEVNSEIYNFIEQIIRTTF